MNAVEAVETRTLDPRRGTQIINVTDINQSEPDAKWFHVPGGHTVVDRRVKTGERAKK